LELSITWSTCQIHRLSRLYVSCQIPTGDPQAGRRLQTVSFFIINGQYSVAVSKDMQSSGLLESIVKHFREWKCFIIWSRDKSRLCQISGYYNWCNHFSIFKPTWAMNVLGARFMWTELGRPTPPKSATEIGRSARRTKKNYKNDKKYKIRNLFKSNLRMVSIRFHFSSNGVKVIIVVLKKEVKSRF
jgi:hypothetical protein